jgi:pimeloyl-ACP methyl ester carboxylesterase
MAQGAAVAAAYIARQQLHGFFEDAPFKMAVFLCTALIPPDIATSSKMADTMGTLGQVDIPTLHIIGRKDLCKAQSLELVKLCKRDSAQVLLNDGGHDIPRDVESTRTIALAMERAMHVALSG